MSYFNERDFLLACGNHTDPENLTLFQRAALTGAEGLCQTAVESKRMRALVERPVIAAVSLDCIPFNQNANPGAPALIKISFLKAGLEHSIAITGKEIADNTLPLSTMKGIPGLNYRAVIVAADWSSYDAARHLPKPFCDAVRPQEALSDIYINPQLAHEGYGLDALASTLSLPGRPFSSSDLSVQEVGKLFHDTELDVLAKARALCDWKIRTIRKSLTKIEKRMIAGLYYTKDLDAELESGKQWVIGRSVEIDRALTQGACPAPKAQTQGEATQRDLF